MTDERRAETASGFKTFGDWWIKNGDKYSLEDADAAAEDVWKDRDAEIAALQERIRVLEAESEAKIAAAYKAAADLLKRSPKHEWSHMTQQDWVESVLALTPESARRELDRQLAAARLEEHDESCALCSPSVEPDKMGCNHRGDLVFALASLSQPVPRRE